MGATIRIQPLDGAWETLGVGRHGGITAEGIELTADEWGSLGANFTLAAQPGVQRPDLLPFTPIEFEDDGILCWSGFVSERPSGEREHSVSCKGWQFHLDDDPFERVYVHTRVGDWRDHRTFPGADLTLMKESGSVTNDSGLIVFGWAQGAHVAADQQVGVTLDLGPDSTAKRVVVETQAINGNAFATFRVRGHDVIPWVAVEDPITVGFENLTDDFRSGTFATARRYVTILMHRDDAGSGDAGADHLVRLKTIRIFRATAYESANASILKASDVIKDALPFAPLLNQSTAGIGAGTFSIPEHAPPGYISPRARMETVNAYENKQLKVDVEKRLIYRVKPTAPLFAVGADSGYAFAEEGISGEEIYNQVRVEGTSPSGEPIRVLRTQTSTLVDRRSFDRTAVLPISQPLTTADANRIGDLWLAEHKTAPFAGTLTVSGAGVRKVLGGEAVPPAAMLLHTGERLRLDDRIDPDTGAQGRDGRIAAVRYVPATKALEIRLDERRDDLASFLSRFGILKEQPLSQRGIHRDDAGPLAR